MRALNLIIKREYLTRIKKKSFLVLTILMPIIFIAFIFVPLLLSGIKDSETKRIVIIDNTGKYASYLKSSDYYSFEWSEYPSDDIKPQIGKEIYGVLQITGDLSLSPKSVTFLSEKQAPMELLTYINHTLSEVTKQERLNTLAVSDNIDPQVIASIQEVLKSSDNISVSTLRWDEDGLEKETHTAVASIIGMVFTFLMYMFIMMYGAMVMNGVVEEKTNRIIEVMISAVRPFDLMMGKIIGIGLTGLTQLLIWFVLIVAALGIKNQLFSDSDMSGIHLMLTDLSVLSSVNWGEILLFFLLLFVGGYLIYASLFAMIGAIVDNAQDTQQFVMPISLIFVFSLYAGIYSIQNPDGPLVFWCSMFPLTSPIVMMVRIPFEIPLWEKLLSLALLYTTIFFMVKFAAKIYRVGILMYGKKPTIKEIWKWFSYK